MKHKKSLVFGISWVVIGTLLGSSICWGVTPAARTSSANPREGAFESSYRLYDPGVPFVEAPLQEGEDYEIVWEDPVIEAAVRGYLGKEEGPILHSDVWDIHVFDLDASGARILREAKGNVFPTIGRTAGDYREIPVLEEKVSTLRDFRHFDALQLLCLIGINRYVGDVTDVSGLEELENLSVLRLISCVRAEDLTPLADCKGLQTLALSGYGVKDITPLESLTELQRLELGSTRVKDLTPLSSLKKLEYLDLGRAIGDPAVMEDYRPLGELTALRKLDLTNTTVKDLAFCENLEELETLRILGTPAAKDWKVWKEKLLDVQVQFNY